MGVFNIKPKTPSFKDKSGNVLAGSVASLEKLTIGGIEQWILARGRDVTKPLLLFLHGGPGIAEMCLQTRFNRVLEDHFIVVNWDQRGTCKSYSREVPVDTMTIDRFLADTRELIGHLRERFHKEKLFIIGHSWGSILAMKLASSWPDAIHAVMTIGQVVDFSRGEPFSFDYTVRKATEAGNARALKELRKITPYDYSNVDQVMLQRKWLYHYGGALHGKKGINSLLVEALKAPEFCFSDISKFFAGLKFSNACMWKEIAALNLSKEIPSLQVPVFFFQGRHDYNTPSFLVEEYHDTLKTPMKDLVWFERSAHNPCYEESERFCTEVIERASSVLARGDT